MARTSIILRPFRLPSANSALSPALPSLRPDPAPRPGKRGPTPNITTLRPGLSSQFLPLEISSLFHRLSRNEAQKPGACALIRIGGRPPLLMHSLELSGPPSGPTCISCHPCCSCSSVHGAKPEGSFPLTGSPPANVYTLIPPASPIGSSEMNRRI